MVDKIRNALGDNVIWNGFSINGKIMERFPDFNV